MRPSSILTLALAALAAAAPQGALLAELEGLVGGTLGTLDEVVNAVSMNGLFAEVDLNANVTLLKRSGPQGVYLAHCKEGGVDKGLFMMYYPDMALATHPGMIPYDTLAWNPPKTDYKTSCVGHNVKMLSPVTQVLTSFNIGSNWGSIAQGKKTGTAWNDKGLHMTCVRGSDHTFMTNGNTVCIDWNHCNEDNDN